MLSDLTQTVIVVLNDISSDSASDTEHLSLEDAPLRDLLSRLESGGLICLKDPSLAVTLSSYRLARPYSEISLLDILVATGEHLDCNRPIDEKLYHRYHVAAQRLGIINHMTRLYLSEIRLSDL